MRAPSRMQERLVQRCSGCRADLHAGLPSAQVPAHDAGVRAMPCRPCSALHFITCRHCYAMLCNTMWLML